MKAVIISIIKMIDMCIYLSSHIHNMLIFEFLLIYDANIAIIYVNIDSIEFLNIRLWINVDTTELFIVQIKVYIYIV